MLNLTLSALALTDSKMMTRTGYLILIIISSGIADAQNIPYSRDSESRVLQNFSINTRNLGSSDMVAERLGDWITVRTSVELDVVDIIEIARYAVDSHEEIGLGLRILWNKDEEGSSKGSVVYKSGVTVWPEFLELLASASDGVQVAERVLNRVEGIIPHDKYEGQDDNLAGATELSENAEHTLHKSDSDWFVYKAPETNIYLIETRSVDGKSLVDTVLHLSLDDGVVLSDDDSGEGLYSRLTFEGEQSTEYPIEVTAYGEDSGYYEIHLGVAPDVEDEYEPNERQGDGAIIDVGSTLEARLTSTSDVDWYLIQGLQNGSIYEVMFMSDVRDSIAMIYRGERESIALAPWDEERFMVTTRGLNYYLKVAGGVGEYALYIREMELLFL